MKTGGMAKAKKYREGGAVGMKKPMPAATRSRARGDDKPPMGRSSMSAEQMRDRRESDAEMGNLGTEIGDMMRRRAAGFKKGGKVKKYQAGGRVRARGDDEGRAAEDMELERARREFDQAYRDADINYRNQALRGAAQIRNWEASRRQGEAGMAAGRYPNEDSKDRESALDRIREQRELNERNPQVKKPRALKTGGKVVAKKAGGMIKAKGSK